MDQKTIEFVSEFCLKNVSCGVHSIYLIGSQARGTATSKSDHDFLAVISDDCDEGLATGGKLWSILYAKLNAERKQVGLGEVDLFVKRKASFDVAKQFRGDNINPSFAAVTEGKKIL